MIDVKTLARLAARRAFSEIGALAALFVFGLGALAFIHIAEEMVEGETHMFDRAILLAVRDWPQPAWAQQVMGDLTALGGYAVLTLLVAGVALYLVAAGKHAAAFTVIGAVLSGALLSESLKMGFARPRPELVEHWAAVHSMSFPSGHAMLSAVTYLTLGVLLARVHARRRIKVLAISYGVALTLIVGLSRIYLGVHWPTDVLAGWAMGAAWAALWWLIAWRLQRSSLIEGDAETAVKP